MSAIAPPGQLRRSASLNFSMATINKRTRLLVRWSPLLLAASTIWTILVWRHEPGSFVYFSACVAVGLVCGALIIADLWKEISPLVYMLWVMVFISSPMFIAAILYSDFQGKMNYQYMSLVIATILGLMVLFRGRLMKLALHDSKCTTTRG
ncbi:MAG TPA: hypothetical protein VIT88_05285 [Pyrinomonadaceae bacterium]